MRTLPFCFGGFPYYRSKQVHSENVKLDEIHFVQFSTVVFKDK